MAGGGPQIYTSFSFQVPMTKSSSLFCLDCTHFAYDSSVVLIDLCPRSLLTSSSGTPFFSRSTANVSRRQCCVKSVFLPNVARKSFRRSCCQFVTAVWTLPFPVPQ